MSMRIQTGDNSSYVKEEIFFSANPIWVLKLLKFREMNIFSLDSAHVRRRSVATSNKTFPKF